MNKQIASFFLIFSFFSLFTVSRAYAKVITEKTGSVDILQNEVINDDLFIGAQSVNIEGVVNGDVFIGAQTVKITGTINGNLHVGANTLDLNGIVKGNVYGGAQNVLVNSSTINGSLLVGAATVTIDKESTIEGSILAGAGTLSVNCQVKRSVYAGAGSLTIGNNAKIGKDLYYATGKGQGQSHISPSAIIEGSTHKSEIDTQNKVKADAVKKQIPAVIGTIRVSATIISFIGALVVGFLYLKLFGKHFSQTMDLATKDFWKTLGIGFLVMITLIPGLVMLCVTIVGIPLAGIVLLMFLLYAYLAKIVAGMIFGKWISQKMSLKTSTFGMLALGLLAIDIVKLVPVIGFLTGLVVLWLGLGAFALKIFTKPS